MLTSSYLVAFDHSYCVVRIHNRFYHWKILGGVPPPLPLSTPCSNIGTNVVPPNPSKSVHNPHIYIIHSYVIHTTPRSYAVNLKTRKNSLPAMLFFSHRQTCDLPVITIGGGSAATSRETMEVVPLPLDRWTRNARGYEVDPR